MARLSDGEIEVMQILWKYGAQKPAEIEERFPRPISNMALRSVLRVLINKRHVRRRKTGRAYYYQAKTPRDKVFKNLTHRMAKNFAEGRPFALIAQMIQSEDLSEEHIKELQRIVSEKAKKGSTRTGRTKR